MYNKKRKRHRFVAAVVVLALVVTVGSYALGHYDVLAFAAREIVDAVVNPAEKEEARQATVPIIYQNPELINGCEATSLTMLLQYYGYDVDKEEVAYRYLPRVDFEKIDGVRYGADPEVAYAGDPATTEGFYCFAPAMVQGANTYLQERGSNAQGCDISGASREELWQYVGNGTPVIIWITMDYGCTVTYLDSYTWQLPSGETYLPYSNLHCVVLAAIEGDNYVVNDPLNGVLTIQQDVVYNSYCTLGEHAMVIQ